MEPALKKRLISAAIIVIVVLCAILFAPVWLLFLLLLAIYTFGMIEFYSFLEAAGIPHFKYLGLLGGYVLLVGTWIGYHYACRLSPSDCELLVLLCLTLGVLLRTFSQKHNQEQLSTIATTLLGVLYIPFLLSFFIKLLWLGYPVGHSLEGGDARWLIVYMLLVVKWTDGGAYFTGRAFGKHKLFPRLSPKKTWEGLMGGLATGIVVSLLYYFISTGGPGKFDFGLELHDAIILGLLIGIFGVLGDLVESMLKRAAGVKDSSKAIRGMGGVLDVMDSPLFAAPLVYYYVKLFL